eukprot:3495991-Prymnesium_polylepis.1
MTPRRGDAQRRKQLWPAGAVHRRAGGEQQVDDCHMASLGRRVKRRGARFVHALVRCGAGTEEHCDDR